MNFREQSLAALQQSDVDTKLKMVSAIDIGTHSLDTHQIIQNTQELPGRPALPELVDPRSVKMRAVGSEQGRAALLHAIAHIEFNAINLALDIVWRFPNMPDSFYTDWMRVAKEEVFHFSLVRAHLANLGYAYGDFTAHSGLWDMSEKTAHDITARLALVPRTLEARGLDVNPAMQDKFTQIGDTKAVEILSIILRDEIGHVEIGNRWYKYMCEQLGVEPIAYYTHLLKTYNANKPKGPFNIKDRMKAGFTQEEIDWLQSL